MEIMHRMENEIMIITIEGQLDAATSPEADEFIKKKLKGNTSRLLFDLEGLDYLSSAGLRVVLRAAKQISTSAGKVALTGLNKYVYEIFEVSGFTALFLIKETLEEALKDLALEKAS